MRPRFLLLCAVLSLASCGNPLRDVARIGDVDVTGDGAAAALPSEAELSGEGFLGTPAASGPVPDGLAAPAARTGGILSRILQPAPAKEPTAARGGPDGADVPFGTLLPFGQIARVCEARGKPLGPKTETTSRRGFALHDSVPGSTAPRTFFLTGFDDNCPRQFTAANALFGSPSRYEQIRYSGAGAHLPYAETDAAYDRLKSRVCRKGKRKPCGDKIARLDTSTVFVSAYERYDNNARWKEFLIHDGQTLAAAVKTFDQ